MEESHPRSGLATIRSREPRGLPPPEVLHPHAGDAGIIHRSRARLLCLFILSFSSSSPSFDSVHPLPKYGCYRVSLPSSPSRGFSMSLPILGPKGGLHTTPSLANPGLPDDCLLFISSGQYGKGAVTEMPSASCTMPRPAYSRCDHKGDESPRFLFLLHLLLTVNC